MISIFYANHCNCLRLSWINFTRHYWRTRFIWWKNKFTISSLGPEPRNLISFAIFIKHTAVVFNVPEKFANSSCAANAANLFVAGLNAILVILLISLTIFLSKFFLVFKPVPTAVPPWANIVFLSASSILEIHFLIEHGNPRILI